VFVSVRWYRGRMVYAAKDIKQLGTIVGVWAHPDDEAFASAGLMAAAVKNGQRVVVVTATPGEAGQTADQKRWPQHKLGIIRRQELHTSLNHSGVREHYWLDYADGALHTVPSEGPVSFLKNLIAGIGPSTVVSFGPDGITGHTDHITVHHWARQAVTGTASRLLCAVENKESYEQAGKQGDKQFNIYFNTAAPLTVPKAQADICYELSADSAAAKLAALRAHASQTAHLFGSQEGRRVLASLARCECYLWYRD
jgi:LmbE family N-acetylglucosaminyl deacetylase